MGGEGADYPTFAYCWVCTSPSEAPGVVRCQIQDSELDGPGSDLVLYGDSYVPKNQ